jgi:hypothetical protein
MGKAKIELLSKPVDYTQGVYEHLFILFTFSNCAKKGYNCSAPQLLFEGSDKEVKLLHNTLLQNAEIINKSYYDFDILPTLKEGDSY